MLQFNTQCDVQNGCEPLVCARFYVAKQSVLPIAIQQ